MAAETPTLGISPQTLEGSLLATNDSPRGLRNKTFSRRQFIELGIAAAGVLIAGTGERIESDSKKDMQKLQTESGGMILLSPTQQTIFDAEKENLQTRIESEENQGKWGKGITWLGIGVAAGGAIALKYDALKNYLAGSEPSSQEESPQLDQKS